MTSPFAAKTGENESMSSKFAVIVIALAVAIVLTAFLRAPVQADDTVQLESYTLDPNPVVVNESLEIGVKLANETDVSEVYMNLCSSLNCFPPETMTRGADGVWRATSDAVTSIDHYYFTIAVKYTNDTVVNSDKVYFTPVSRDLQVSSISQAPEKVRKGDAVDVFVRLASEENVSKVMLYHCQGDVCFTPTEMTALQNGTYTAKMGPFDELDEVKYNVTVEFSDGTLSWTSWTVDHSFTPKKKSGDGGDDDGVIPAVGAAAAIAVLAGLAVTRRGHQS